MMDRNTKQKSTSARRPDHRSNASTAAKPDPSTPKDSAASPVAPSPSESANVFTEEAGITVPPFGLEKVKAAAKKIKTVDDTTGDGSIEALSDAVYSSLTLDEKFTYNMINPEVSSQMCDALPERKDESARIYGELPDYFGEYEWSDRQIAFFKDNRDSVEQLEIACRAGTRTDYFFGAEDTRIGEYANIWHGRDHLKPDHGDPYMYTSPVGSFRPNPWGLYDMYGNVFEFCTGKVSPAESPGIAHGRGGSWWCSKNACHSFNSYSIGQVNVHASFSNQGFRAVTTP